MLAIFFKQIELLGFRINTVLNYLELTLMQQELSHALSNLQLLDSNLSHFKIKDYSDLIKFVVKSPLPYNSIIISIYGCFENFIDDLLICYLEELQKLNIDFNSISNELKKNNIIMSSEFLKNQNRFKHIDLTENEVIDKISSAKLVNKLLIKHGGNLSLDELQRLFKQIGILNLSSDIKSQATFIEYYMNLKELSREKATKILNSDVNNTSLSLLEILIQKRNIIAHSWGDENKISFEIIKNDWIPFIITLCECINLIVCEEYCKAAILNGKIKPLKNYNRFSSTLVGVKGSPCKINLNDYICLQRSDDFRLGQIISIRENDNDCDSCEIGSDISLRLSCKITCDSNLFVLKL